MMIDDDDFFVLDLFFANIAFSLLKLKPMKMMRMVRMLRMMLMMILLSRATLESVFPEIAHTLQDARHSLAWNSSSKYVIR